MKSKKREPDFKKKENIVRDNLIGPVTPGLLSRRHFLRTAGIGAAAL